MNLVGPWVLAEIKPPPVGLLAMSPTLLNVAPRMATAWPSILTVLEYFLGESSDLPTLGSGVGTNGGGGPGILQIFGIVILATPRLPEVTGVLGGCTPTLRP